MAVVATCESNWIVGIDVKSKNPSDEATLKPMLEQVKTLIGEKPQAASWIKGAVGAIIIWKVLRFTSVESENSSSNSRSC